MTYRENPLLCMWGGAVNRQPGYRARNLQRRGFLSTTIISDARASFHDDSLLSFRIFMFFNFSIFFRSQYSLARHGITRPIVYRMSWGFACLQLNPIRPGHIFYIESEFRNFPGEPKIYLKVLVNCRPSITVFFVPGVLLTEGRILSSASYTRPTILGNFQVDFRFPWKIP